MPTPSTKPSMMPSEPSIQNANPFRWPINESLLRRQNGWGVVQIAASWDRVERIIARVEAGPPRTLYQNIYSARGQLRFTSRCGRPISRPTAPRARGLVGNAKYGVACTNLKIWHISPVFAA